MRRHELRDPEPTLVLVLPDGRELKCFEREDLSYAGLSRLQDTAKAALKGGDRGLLGLWLEVASPDYESSVLDAFHTPRQVGEALRFLHGELTGDPLAECSPSGEGA